MLRTLLLLRHAKSGYPDGVADHDRPLADRGEREAALAGAWIAENAPKVGLVLSSSATRTRQTLACTGLHAPARYCDALYDATPGTVLEQVNRVDPDVETVLVVGHEPTMSALSLGLAALPETGPESDAAEKIAAKFPTAAVAVLSAEVPWRDWELGCARLTDFHVAR